MILLSPLLIDTVPPLLDYPIHLARSYIATEHGNNPILSEIYSVTWRPLPNLAGDIALFILTKFIAIELAGRVVLAFCLVCTFLGTLILFRVNFGVWSYWPFLAALLVYHGALTAGFLNYSIGVALLPFALAASISARRVSPHLALIVNSISAIILLFCHVIVVGLFGIFLFAKEVTYIAKNSQRYSPKTNIPWSVLFLLVPFIVPSIFYIRYSLYEVVARPDYLLFGPWLLSEKVRGVLMPFHSGDLFIDILCFIVFFSIIFIFIIKQKIYIDYSLISGSIIVYILFLLLPGHLLDAAFISERLSIVALLIGLTGMRPRPTKKRWACLLACLVVAIASVRTSHLTSDWTESDAYYDRLAQSISSIEPGSSVMIVSPLKGADKKSAVSWFKTRYDNPRWHFTLLNIPTLHAFSAILLARRSTFTQIHFVWADKQILSLSESFKHLDYGDGGNSAWDPNEIFTAVSNTRLGMTNAASPFDYILIVYAQLLEPELRTKIHLASPIYADPDILLLRNDWATSWRNWRLDPSRDVELRHIN